METFNDPIRVRGTASNLYLKHIRVIGRHDSDIWLNAGYNRQRPGLFGVVLDRCVVQDSRGAGFRVDTPFVCEGHQGLDCSTDSTVCGSWGLCGSAEAWNITFLRSYALSNTRQGQEPDGFQAPHDRTHSLTFDRTVASGNGGDGYDIGANFSQFRYQVTKFLDVAGIGNAKKGIYTWHSTQIENGWAVRNREAGIRSARNTAPTLDTTIARITIVNATVVGNENRQISLGERGGYADVRIFNTIGCSTVNSQSEALEYRRSHPSFSIAWDWNVFYREGGGRVIEYDADVGCRAEQVRTCDGDHPIPLAKHLGSKTGLSATYAKAVRVGIKDSAPVSFHNSRGLRSTGQRRGTTKGIRGLGGGRTRSVLSRALEAVRSRPGPVVYSS